MPDNAIFLDRDDTLIEDIGYISSPEHVKLIEGAAEALIEFKKMGYKLIIVSNQSGVARGYFTEETLAKIHEKLEQLFRQKGAYLDKIYYCPYLAEAAIEKYRMDSDERKPKPGMLLKAAAELNIDLAKSWMIGDGQRDIDAGKAAGCKTILIRPSSQTISLDKDISSNADYVAVNMREAVNIVKKFKSQSVFPTSAGQSAAQKQTSQPVMPVAEQPKPDPVAPPAAAQSRPVDAKPSVSPENEKPVAKQTLKPAVTEPKPASKTNTEDLHPASHHLLSEILNELKALRRTDLFADFSIMRFLAGMVQVIVLLCLLISVWILMNPSKSGNADSILITLGFAAVLQIMALTLYVQSRK